MELVGKKNVELRRVMMLEVKDVMGRVVKIGDTVAFAGAGRGASQFLSGKVVRFAGTMSVEIEHETYQSGYINRFKTIRKSGNFAIVNFVEEDYCDPMFELNG